MTKIKLVIVDDDSDLCEQIKAQIDSCESMVEVAGIAYDGYSGLELINKLKPDAVLLEVALPWIDGISVLSELRRNAEVAGALCVMMSAIGNDLILKEAGSRGCDYFYVKPLNTSGIGDKIKCLFDYKSNLANHTTGSENRGLSAFPDAGTRADAGSSVSEADVITKLLWSVGVRHMNNGFYFLKHAISLCVNEKRLMDRVTKELYPSVAKEFKTTNERVERSIRHLLKTCWDNGAGGPFVDATGFPPEYKDIKPTNSMFIHQAVDIYKRTYK